MIIEQLGRGAAVVGLSRSILGRLLAEMDMQGTLLYRLLDRAQRLSRHRAYGMNGGTDAHQITISERAHPLLPVINIAVAESSLHRIQWQIAGCGESAREVTHVEQGEPDARFSGSLDQGRAHGIRIAVRAASLIMVQIVKLPDDGVSGRRHLGEYRA